MVSESGWFGLGLPEGPTPPFPFPLPLPVVPVGVLVVVGTVVVAGIGEVIAGIDTVGAVVSPELSLPQPATASTTAMEVKASARLTRSRRAPAGEARNTGSR